MEKSAPVCISNNKISGKSTKVSNDNSKPI
jgi:hypothetical protein